MEKLFQSTARGAKASDYKQDKNEAQQKKAKEVADAKAKGRGSDPKGKGLEPKKPRACWGCSKPWTEREELKKHLPTCPAKNKVCSGCKREGATPAHCVCQGKGPVVERKPKRPCWSEIVEIAESRCHLTIVPLPTWRM